MERLTAAVVMTVVMTVVLVAPPVVCYPQGAPLSTCSSLIPGHGTQSTADSPYTLSMGAATYRAGSNITVTVSGAAFMGILMQVRQAGSDSDTAYGTWSELPADTRYLDCTNGKSVTHKNTNSKQNAVFIWTAPEAVTHDLQFIATVAVKKNTWWQGLTSASLTYDGTTTSTPHPTTTPPPTAASSPSTRIGPAASSLSMTVIVTLLVLWLY